MNIPRFYKLLSTPYLFQQYLIFLVLLSVLPVNNSGAAINHVYLTQIRLDYILHCLVYIPLALLLKLSFGQLKRLTFLSRIILLILFAVITEGVQYMLPYRSFNINDLIANCMGVIAGLLPLWLYNMRMKSMKIKSNVILDKIPDNYEVRLP